MSFIQRRQIMIERKFMVEIKSKVNLHSHKIMLNMPYIHVELKNQMTSFTAKLVLWNDWQTRLGENRIQG